MAEPTWHPILAAEEREPGIWLMIDGLGHQYGRIEIRRTPVGVRYRAELHDVHIGWATSLNVACVQVHMAFVRSHGPGFASAAPVPQERQSTPSRPEG